MSGSAYKDAGVDIDLAKGLLSKMKSKIAEARRPEMLAPVGGFGGLFELDLSKYNQPVLVSSVDGVGTKLAVAMMMGKFDSVGHDIVNHCVNDIIVQGAEPIYFLDYIGIGKLRSPLYEEVLTGLAEACAAAGCALLGGETAEMPGMYGDDFDLVGSITGVVEKDKIITGGKIKDGHVAVALASNGLHTNGYSLARHILFEKAEYSVDTELESLDGGSIGEALLKPHTCYWNAVRAMLESRLPIHGMAHITGGGIIDNIPRILPKDVDLDFDTESLPTPPVIQLIVETGGISRDEAHKVFNMGFGMVFFTSADAAESVISIANAHGHEAAVCGKIVAGNGTTRI